VLAGLTVTFETSLKLALTRRQDLYISVGRPEK
jgi:hypothetical protein